MMLRMVKFKLSFRDDWLESIISVLKFWELVFWEGREAKFQDVPEHYWLRYDTINNVDQIVLDLYCTN